VKARAALAVALSALPLAAAAQEDDGIRSFGRLSNADFLRLVTCGAPPGGECRGPVVRWPDRKAGELTVRLMPIAAGIDRDKTARVWAEVDRAIAILNGAGAALRLVRVKEGQADIRIYMTEADEGDPVGQLDMLRANTVMGGVGYVTIWWNGSNRLTDAVILFSDKILDRDIRSVVLEELTQAMGLRYDIANAYYDGRSIVAQDSNDTVTIEGQDRMALRSLYPPAE